MWSRNVPLLLSALALAGCTAAAATVGWDAADDNDDDLVSRTEFSAFMGDVNAFGAYDDDSNGTLNRTEYAEAVEVALEGDAYWRGFDRDYSDDLTEEEFVNGVFASYDRDGDGWLNEAEFAATVDGLAVEL